jgi:hypothetical protein
MTQRRRRLFTISTLAMLAVAGCTERPLHEPQRLVTGLYRVTNVSLDGECVTMAEPSDAWVTAVEVREDGTLTIGLPSLGMFLASIRRPIFTPVAGGFAAADDWSSDCGASITWETFASPDGATLEVTDIAELQAAEGCPLLESLPDTCTIEAVYDLQLQEPCELPCTFEGGGPIEVPPAGEPLDVEPLHCSCPGE